MADMTSPRTAMPQQSGEERIHNFNEVALGYTEEMAVREAGRCLQCKKPFCVEGCPVNVRIPDFIAKVAQGDFEGAYQVISATNGLPAISGRVCPQERQCEAKCVRGIKGEAVAIGRLERFVADWHLAHHKEPAQPEHPRNGVHVAALPAAMSNTNRPSVPRDTLPPLMMLLGSFTTSKLQEIVPASAGMPVGRLSTFRPSLV